MGEVRAERQKRSRGEAHKQMVALLTPEQR
jgi:hypothetical protein